MYRNAVPILMGNHNCDVVPSDWWIVPGKKLRDFVLCPRMENQLQVKHYTNDRIEAYDGLHWAIEVQIFCGPLPPC